MISQFHFRPIDFVNLYFLNLCQDEEAERVKQQRLKEYADKKSKKPALIAKSNIVLDVKPWDDETDMKALEAQVRTIVMDGLIWGACKHKNQVFFPVIC
jgi:hypothetical protein